MTDREGRTSDGISFVTEHERCPDCGRDVHVSETPMHFGCLVALREENSHLRAMAKSGWEGNLLLADALNMPGMKEVATCALAALEPDTMKDPPALAAATARFDEALRRFGGGGRS